MICLFSVCVFFFPLENGTRRKKPLLPPFSFSQSFPLFLVVRRGVCTLKKKKEETFALSWPAVLVEYLIFLFFVS